MIKIIKKIIKGKKGAEIIEVVFLTTASLVVALLLSLWIYKIVNETAEKAEDNYKPDKK